MVEVRTAVTCGGGVTESRIEGEISGVLEASGVVGSKMFIHIQVYQRSSSTFAHLSV